MNPNRNPLHNAIDALHNAFVGTPGQDAGEPVNFAVSDYERIDQAIADFPEVFGLRAFPGRRFFISRSASFVSQGEVKLYTYDADSKLAFSKGTPEELRREVVELEADPAGKPYSKPANLQEAAVESIAFYSEDSPAPLVQVRARLQGFHKVGPSFVTALLAGAAKEELVVLSNGNATLTEDGEELARSRGWLEPIPELARLLPELETESCAHDGGTANEAGYTVCNDCGEDIAAPEGITPERAEVLVQTTSKELVAFAKDHDNAADLRALWLAEKRGKARKTVLAAIEARGKALAPIEVGTDPAKEAFVPTPETDATYNPTRRFPAPVVVTPGQETTGSQVPAEERKRIIEYADRLRNRHRANPETGEPVVVVVPAAPQDAEKALAAVPVPEKPEEDPTPTLNGIEVTPDLPDLSQLSPVEAYLLQRVQELERTVTTLRADVLLLERAKAKPAQAPRAPRASAEPAEGSVIIGELEPGSWIRLPAGKLAVTVSKPGVKWHAYFQQEEDGSWKRDSRLSTSSVTPAEKPDAEALQGLPKAAEKLLG